MKLLLVLLLTATPVPAPEAGADLIVSGRGFGHGRGMSQFGAQGAALAGLDSGRILNFYYPGTSATRVIGSIRVHLTRDTTSSVKVVATAGLRVRDLGNGLSFTLPRATAITQWSIDPYGKHRTRLFFYSAAAKRWVAGRVFAGMAQFEGPASIPLVLPDGSRRRFRGVLRTADRVGGNLDTINVLALDQYLRGVVPREAITSWRPAALQAQAVAARTFAAYHRKRRAKRDYDVCDTISCQVYGGVGAEKASTDAAITATAGLIRTHQGVPIIAEFSSSNGGATASGPEPYQSVKADPYDGHRGNPNHVWKVRVKRARAEAAFGVGRIRRIEVIARNGHGTWGGRALTIRVTGSRAQKTFTGAEVRTKLRLKSTWFTFG